MRPLVVSGSTEKGDWQILASSKLSSPSGNRFDDHLRSLTINMINFAVTRLPSPPLSSRSDHGSIHVEAGSIWFLHQHATLVFVGPVRIAPTPAIISTSVPTLSAWLTARLASFVPDVSANSPRRFNQHGVHDPCGSWWLWEVLATNIV